MSLCRETFICLLRSDSIRNLILAAIGFLSLCFILLVMLIDQELKVYETAIQPILFVLKHDVGQWIFEVSLMLMVQMWSMEFAMNWMDSMEKYMMKRKESEIIKKISCVANTTKLSASKVFEGKPRNSRKLTFNSSRINYCLRIDKYAAINIKVENQNLMIRKLESNRSFRRFVF